MDLDHHRATNLANWNERVPVHAASATYGLDRLVADPAAISDVVAFDRERMGDVTSLRLLHLQCHIGSDTVSWGRLGAQVTGLDFSAPALDVARDLAGRMGLDDARFVEAELYDAPRALDGARFDVVYTGVGALCWLPDIRRWAHVVAALLAPGGRLFVTEGHPVLWALAYERDDDLLVLDLPYFETDAPWQDTDGGTYTDVPDGTAFAETVTYDWNHGIGEILTAVLDAGLAIERFEEHRSVHWQPWDLFEPEPGTGRFALPERLRDRAPLMYTLVARAPSAPPPDAPD